MERKSYVVGSDTYFMEPLSLAQLQHLMPYLQEIESGKGAAVDSMTFSSMMASVGERLPRLLAMVLMKEGESKLDILKMLQSPGLLERRAQELWAELDISLAMRMVQDFFVLNPLSPMLARLAGVFSASQTIESGSISGNSTLKPITLSA